MTAREALRAGNVVRTGGVLKPVETEADIAAGLAALVLICPAMAMIAERHGAPPLRRHPPGFEGLCRIVIGQQLSIASAEAIRLKVMARFETLSPEAFLAASEADLRGCGLSAPKIRTLRAISDAVAQGVLDLSALPALAPEEAIAHMVKVKGIGPWTAEIYLMFYLGHPDIFAAGDLALQEAAKLALGLEARPNAKQMSEIAIRWAPWRAVAARMLWHYYKFAKSREGVIG